MITTRNRIKTLLPLVAVLITGFAFNASAEDAKKPLQVDTLAGQSNMEGHGKVEWGRDRTTTPRSQVQQVKFKGDSAA